MFPYGDTVTRLRAVLIEDPYSSEPTLADWNDDENPPAELAIPDCAFDPGGSIETVEVGRQPIITKPTVYAPYGSDIKPVDRLVVGGVTYDVDGNPRPWKSPFTGWTPGLVVELNIVEG